MKFDSTLAPPPKPNLTTIPVSQSEEIDLDDGEMSDIGVD